MNNPMDELIRTAKASYTLIVTGDGSFNAEADRLGNTITAAEEWQKGKEPVVSGDSMTHWYSCPNCKTALAPNQKYCHECTMPLRWGK
jgi:hypothetical protein